MIRQLLYRQWHEQGWRVVFASVLLCGVVAIGLGTRIVPDGLILLFAAGLAVTLLPIFIAMGLVAPCRAERSHAMLIGLPIAPWKTFGVALLSGIVGSAVPVVAATLLALAMAGGREESVSFILIHGLLACLLAGEMVALTLGCSVRQDHEAKAGLSGLVALVALGAVSMFLPRGSLEGIASIAAIACALLLPGLAAAWWGARSFLHSTQVRA